MRAKEAGEPYDEKALAEDARKSVAEVGLVDAGPAVVWHHAIDEVPEGPTIAIANEFVDALPINQFIKDRDGWHMRTVGIADGKLAFLAAPEPMLSKAQTNETPAGTSDVTEARQPLVQLHEPHRCRRE